jgi:hypothetical protein
VALPCTLEKSRTFETAAYGAMTWLRKQQFLDSTRPYTHGLIVSYEDTTDKIKIAYLYDQAVAIIAFSHAYKKINNATDALAIEYKRRAQLILTAVKNLSAQQVDNDWRLAKSNWAAQGSVPVYILRDAYNLNYKNTNECIVYNPLVICTRENKLVNEGAKHVGPQLWLVMAISHYADKTMDTQFNFLIDPIINFCASFQAVDGGLNGGLSLNLDSKGANIPETWASTTHNLDAYAVFRKYRPDTALLTSVSDFLTRAPFGPTGGTSVDAKNGVFNNVIGTDPFTLLKTGPRFLAGRHNYDDILDAQPLGVLAYPDHPSNTNGMEWAEDNNYTYVNAILDSIETSMYGYDFNCDKRANIRKNDDIWWEGTAYMAVAYKSLNNNTRTELIKNWIMQYGQNVNGGVNYSVNGTNNGYSTMSKLPGVASTGWAYFAWMDFNPFALKPGDPLYF